MNYDVNYFINKFEKIPEGLWCSFMLVDGDRHCGLGHCGVTDIDNLNLEGDSLNNLLLRRAADINNSCHPNYQQSTPKQRILAALYDIKKMQEGEKKIEPTPKVVHVYHAIEVDKSLSEQSKELITEN